MSPMPVVSTSERYTATMGSEVEKRVVIPAFDPDMVSGDRAPDGTSDEDSDMAPEVFCDVAPDWSPDVLTEEFPEPEAEKDSPWKEMNPLVLI